MNGGRYTTRKVVDARGTALGLRHAMASCGSKMLLIIALAFCSYVLEADQGYDDSPTFTLDTRWQTFLGVGDSSLFSLDTRYERGLAAANSHLFILDTRYSTSSGAADSLDFTLDTRVASTAFFSGLVNSGSTPLAGAIVSALLNGRVFTTATCDGLGGYSLGPVPAGTYQLRAAFPDYLTAIRYAMTVGPGQTALANFNLAAKPPGPTVTNSTRQSTPSERPQISHAGLTNLLLFTNGGFVTVTTQKLDQARMTVVLTHGCCHTPNSWAAPMATQLVQTLGQDSVNILAWDWREDARTNHTGLAYAWSKISPNGRALGRALYANLGGSYSQPLHFMGHSYGTLVNRYAADYLHGDDGKTNQPPSPWSWSRTHLTLFDEGELGRWLGQAVVAGEAIKLVDTALTSGDPQDAFVAGAYIVGVVPSLELSVGRNPMPARFQWSDNYISAGGKYQARALNVYLSNAGPETWFDLVRMHAYPIGWYQGTVDSPTRCILGFTNSFEITDTLPPSQEFKPKQGLAYVQNSLPFLDRYSMARREDYSFEGDNLLRLASDTVGGLRLVAAQVLTHVATVGAENAAQGIQAVVEGTGNFVSFVGETFDIGINAAISAGRTATGLIQTGIQRTGEAIVDFPRWIGKFRLFGGSSSQSPLLNGVAGAGGGQGSPSMTWLRVQVPTNAHLLSFEITFSGDTAQDCFGFAINGTNVLTFEAQYFENDVPINTGLIDVSGFAGQEIELSFGLFNSASTNASVEVSAIRFFNVPPPALSVQQAGANVVVSWPLYATGYVLESATGLAATNGWSIITNTPSVVDFQNTVTNSISEEKRFFRLRRY